MRVGKCPQYVVQKAQIPSPLQKSLESHLTEWHLLFRAVIWIMTVMLAILSLEKDGDARTDAIKIMAEMKNMKP